jgi:hypothetical protein
MWRRLSSPLACCAALSLASAPLRAQVAIPNTPAGIALRAWIDAYNKGDSASVATFLRSYQVAAGLRNSFEFRPMTGGFDVLSVEVSESQHIEFILRMRRSPMAGYGALDVVPGNPDLLESSLELIGSDASPEALRIDSATRARVVRRVAAVLDSFYVSPDVGRRIRDTLRARLARGVYDRYSKGVTLSIRLKADLEELAHDGHLRLIYSLLPSAPEPPVTAVPTAPSPEERRAIDRINFCEFRKAEVLDDNVGYLRFDAFMDPARCGSTAESAMTFLADTRVLIIDLRENGGGDIFMPSLIASYLLDRRTHLTDLWNRRTDSTLVFWSRDSVVGRRFGGDKPIYILTSAYTASAAEELAYDLQALKRASIVGETTAGEAHPTFQARIGGHFGLLVPSGKAINPITGTNWEGVGVVPDIKVAASEALEAVRKLIRDKTPG